MIEQESRIKIIKPINKTNQLEEFNLNPILEDCMGQVDLLEELVQLFNSNILEFIGKTKVYLLNDNHAGIAFISHKIKNGLQMFKLNNLVEICEQMNLVSKTDKDIKHLNFLYGEFLKEYKSIAPKIELELKRITLN